MLNPFTHKKVLRNGVPGRATIVEMGALDRGGTSFNLPMTLQIHVDGMTPYEVEDQWMVKAKDTIGLSGWIPVRVDRERPERVAIDWEGVRANYEQSKAARRDALASGGATGITGLDADTSEQVQQALGAMGINLDLSNATVMSYPPQEFTVGAFGGGEDDTIGKLERLAALRASGALTDAEFEVQKRRLLDGS
jgi:Short C-terminal domain